MCTMRPPPRFTISSWTACAQRNRLFTLTAITRSHSSGRDVDDLRGAQDAGVVHEDVDAAELRDRPRHHRLDLGRIGDVDRIANDAVAVLARAVGDRLDRFGVDVGGEHAAAVTREALRDRPAHALSRAGDDDGAPVEPSHDPSFGARLGVPAAMIARRQGPDGPSRPTSGWRSPTMASAISLRSPRGERVRVVDEQIVYRNPYPNHRPETVSGSTLAWSRLGSDPSPRRACCARSGAVRRR